MPPAELESIRAATVRGDPVVQRAGMVETARTGAHPERLAMNLRVPPFDATAFAANPEAYLNDVAPGRVYAVADPGPGVPALTLLSPGMQPMVETGTVTIAVRTAPGAPVTFTALDRAIFANGLTTETVRAAADGRAAIACTAPPGTVGPCQVLIGSPQATGTLTLHLDIAPRSSSTAAGKAE